MATARIQAIFPLPLWMGLLLCDRQPNRVGTIDIYAECKVKDRVENK